MNNSPNRLRRLLTVAVLLSALGVVAVLILSDRARSLSALEEVRREGADLRERDSFAVRRGEAPIATDAGASGRAD
jgi:hypothetical protein